MRQALALSSLVFLLVLVGCDDPLEPAQDAATPARDSGPRGDAGAPRDGATMPDAASRDAGAVAVEDWPPFGGVTPRSRPIHTEMVAPGYLEWTLDPRTLPPHITDGRVPTEVARISDAAAFGLGASASFHVQYSKVTPWNADDSLVIIFYSGDGSGALLLDGRTFEFRRRVSGLYGTGRWSLTRPNVWIQPESDFVPRFIEIDVMTDAVSTFHDFSAEGYVDRADQGLYGYEGNQSNDDRIWAFNLQRSGGAWELVIWDSVANNIMGRIPTPGPIGSGTDVDWWTVSQAGQFIVTQTHAAWMSAGRMVPVGNNVWSLTGELLATNDTSTGHLDVCLDEDGNDVLAFIGSKYESNDKVLQTWRLDGSDGASTRDHMPDGYIGWAYHMNCRNTLRPGFISVSSSLGRPTSNYNTFPMWNHVFAVQMGGSGEPGIIGNTHHSEGGESAREYERSPFSPVNRHLTAVMFGADWDTSSSQPIQIYVARPRR